MNPLPALLLFLGLSGFALAKESLIYIASGGKAPETQGIYASALDQERGSLAPPRFVAPLEKPSFLALSPDGRFLYAARQTAEGGVVTTFERMPDGSLRLLNELPTGGKTACHLSVDGTGRFVLVANYSSSSIAIFTVKPDGSLGERTALMELTGSGPDPRRQAAPHPHSIGVDPENRHVYVGDLGSDRVHLFPFDARNGTLGTPSAGEVPPGAGPRHFTFHPNGKFLYACNEMGINVTAFARDKETGGLTPLQTVTTIPADTPTKGVTTAEIHWHPNGKWGYVSNRGHGSIAIFETGSDGRLSPVEIAPAGVGSPWSFAIHEGGSAMLIAGYYDNRLTLQKLDPATGRLGATDAAIIVERPGCVIFVPDKLAVPAAQTAK